MQGFFARKWSCCEQVDRSADGCECVSLLVAILSFSHISLTILDALQRLLLFAQPDKNYMKMLFPADSTANWKRSAGWRKINMALSQWEGVKLNWKGDVKTIALPDNYLSGICRELSNNMILMCQIFKCAIFIEI